MTRILVKNSRPIDAFSPRFLYGLELRFIEILQKLSLADNLIRNILVYNNVNCQKSSLQT